MEIENPWENFSYEQSLENTNSSTFQNKRSPLLDDPPENFNNIKLNGSRHSKVVPEIENVALLPYEAVSWCEDMADNCSKKDRPIKRSKVTSLRRPKRLNAAQTSDMLVSQTLTEKKLNNQPNEIIRTANPVREHNEALREPVLLKLAKAENKAPVNESFKVYVDLNKESKLNDRSIWSVVYSKEQPRFEVLNNLVSKSNSLGRSLGKDNLMQNSLNCTYSNDSGIGTQSFGTSSSYPQTPSLSPHLPSPNPSNISDDVNAVNTGNIRSDHLSRPISRSSTHSSSSSGIGFTDQMQNSLDIGSQLHIPHTNTSKFVDPYNTQTNSTQFHKVGNRTSILRLKGSKSFMFAASNSQNLVADKQKETLSDNEIETAVYNLENENYGIKCKTSSRIVPFSKNQLKKNGYHNWFGETPFLVSDNQNSEGVRTFLAVQQVPGSSNTRFTVQNTSNIRLSKQVNSGQTASNHIFSNDLNNVSSLGESPVLYNPSTTIHSSVEFSKRNVSDGNSILMNKLTKNKANDMYNYVSDVNDEYLLEDQSFNPITQCGFVEIDNIKCKNSILCTVHTMEEKRRVPRPRDLRYLIRDARQKQQALRQVSAVPSHQFIPFALQTSSHPLVSGTVVDLVRDRNSSDDRHGVKQDYLDYTSTNRRPQILRRAAMYHPSAETHIPFFNNSNNHDVRFVTQRIKGGSQDMVMMDSGGAPYFFDSNNQIFPRDSMIGTNLDLDANQLYSDQFTMSFRQNSMTSDVYVCEQGLSNDHAIYPHNSHLSSYPSTSYPQLNKIVKTNTTNNNSIQSQRNGHLLSLQSNWNNNLTRLSHNPISSTYCNTTTTTNSNYSNIVNLDNLISVDQECVVLDDNDDDDEGGGIGDGNGSSDLTIMDSNNSIRKQRPMINEHLNYGPINLTSNAPNQGTFTCRNVHDFHSNPSLDLVDTADMSNHFVRGSVFRNAQVMREAQGRVIVDDIREKSITGRSRKTARATFRSSGSNIQNSNFANILQLRYQQRQQQKQQSSQIQSTSGIFTNRNKPATTSGLVSNIFHKSSLVDLHSTNKGLSVPIYNSHDEMDNATSQLLYHPTSVFSPTVNPMDALIVDPSSTSPVNDVNPKLSSKYVSNHLVEYEGVDSNLAPHASAQIVNSFSQTIPTYALHSNSRSAQFSLQNNISQFNQPYQNRSHFASSISDNTNVSNEGGTILPPNRYLVIRPRAIRQSANLVLRAKRGDTISTFSTNRTADDL